jgi:peptide/nickel transport system permease protein
LGLLTLLAWLAPLIATDRAWIARGPDGLYSPAFRVWVGLSAPPTAEEGERLLAAPIPHDPYRVRLQASLRPPSKGHWLGTDTLGRDMTARVLHGGRVSLTVGALAAGLSLLLGLPLGAVAGYRGGWADWLVSRGIEAVLCIPTILLALVLLAQVPGRLAEMSGTLRVALIIGLTGWVAIARYLRGEFMKLRGSDMVVAARAAGSGHLRVVVRHLLPCSLAPVLVTTAFAIGAAILLEAALAFLGFGVAPPVPSWGGLLNEAREQLERGWWLALFPGIALFLTVLGCNLLGEGVRELLDPRTTSRR